jgi:tetratricopeptide (TPR) repeat protein
MAIADEATVEHQRAKQLRDLGAEAIERKDFATALDAFGRAYALFPSPNLRFNMGVALDQLGRSAEAIEAFEDFLAATSDVPAEGGEYAGTRIAALSPRVARVDIIAPPSARVTVDGIAIALPRTRPLPAMPGQREISASRVGYVTASQRVRLVAGERRRVELTLEPLVRTSPAPPPPRALARTPVHRKWWLWTSLGAVVTGGAVALGVALSQPSDATAPGAIRVKWK